MDRQSVERDAIFNSHGYSAEGAKLETVVRISVGNTVHHVRMDAGVLSAVDIPVFCLEVPI